MAEFTQDARFISVNTTLGKDKLLLAGFTGREEIGRLFEFELDLRSPDNAIKFEDIVGKNLTFRVDRMDGEKRWFNGYVSRFSQVGQVTQDQVLASYRAEVVPWLWFLTRTADCRIFQKTTVPDLIKKVCKEYGFTDIDDRLSPDYRTWEYCTQYRETDFNFLSRLMEQEGIAYYFKHEEKKHTLVLFDSAANLDTFSGADTLKFRIFSTATVVEEHILDWKMEKEVQPGKYAHADYNFKTPHTRLLFQEDQSQKHDKGDAEIYDYPGEFPTRKEGEQYAKIRVEELQTRYGRYKGTANARGVCAGHKFTLENHPRKDQNVEHLFTVSSYRAWTGGYGAGEDAGETFECDFTAIEAKTQFRTARITPKPIVQGLQTAVVVGPKGEEIYTDNYGRVKVQFHWDREGKSDENSSCWIRVSQVHAGKGFGGIDIPRIGEEVVISYLEGDPDQPLIVGRVYNDDQKVPFGLPDKKVVSGMKTNTHKGGGYNEMSMDDTAGKEGITIHAQYDMNTTVENNQTTTVHNNRTDTIDVNDTETVGSNQKITIGANQTTEVGGAQKLTVGGSQSTAIGASQELTVGAGQSNTIGADQKISVGGGLTEVVGGALKLTVGGASTTTVGGTGKISVAGALSIESPSAITITSAASIKLTGGGGVIEISAAGVKITGAVVESIGGLVKNNG